MDYHFHSAKLIRVVDGDTVHMRTDLGHSVFTEQKYRLAGINCPEKNTDEGQAAMRFTESWFARHGGECAIASHGQDKYGRWLATIQSTTDQHDTLNGALQANSFAAEYRG